jgi:hypothetical protein
MKIIIVALLLAALAIPAAASAQSANGDSNWTAWLGCWELIQDDTRSGSPRVPTVRTESARASTSRPADMRVCVTQDASNAGVKMTTFAAGQVVLEQAIVADGRERPLNETGCTASQRAEWSGNRRQLFMRAEMQCKDQPRRSVTGITLIANGPAWLDLQALDVGGDQLLRVRRYQRVAADQSPLSPDVAARADAEAQRLAATPLKVEDVIQASSNVASKAVEAMLIETRATFDLDGRALLQLQKAGVAGGVTDLMVALSFPDRFVVERQVESRSSSSFLSPFSAQYESYWYPAYAPYVPLSLYSPYYYSFYGYSYSPYAYSPFAYGYWSDPYRGIASFGVARPQDGASPNAGEMGAGRALVGRGYTRVRPRNDGAGAAPTDPAASSSGEGSSTRSARSGTRGSNGGSTVSTSGYSRGGSDSSSGGGSSGGGSSSDSGGSSGSSSGSSGRTAQPR